MSEQRSDSSQDKWHPDNRGGYPFMGVERRLWGAHALLAVVTGGAAVHTGRGIFVVFSVAFAALATYEYRLPKRASVVRDVWVGSALVLLVLAAVLVVTV